MACYTFSMLEIRPLTPSRCKNQSSDTLNIIGHNCNHQEFFKQITVALPYWGFKLKFPKRLLRSLFRVNFINITVVTPNWNSIGWNVYVSTVFLLSTVLVTKNLAISISVGFPKNSQIVACCTFGRFRFRTLTRSIFKNQTNGTFKPLGYNWNHQGFLKKIVTLHHCGFNLKFPKYLSWRLLFWVNTIGEIIVTEN